MWWSLLGLSFGSLSWGIIISLALTVLFVFLLRGWYKNAMLTGLTYVVAAVMFFLLSFQTVGLCGAFQLKGITSSVEAQARHIVSSRSVSLGGVVLSLEDGESVARELINEYPALSIVFDASDFRGQRLEDVPAAIADSLRSILNRFILWRFFWCLALLALGFWVMSKTLNRGGGTSSYRQARTASAYHREDAF